MCKIRACKLIRLTSPLEIGGRSPGGSYMFTNWMDEFQVFNRVLNPDEVGALYG